MAARVRRRPGRWLWPTLGPLQRAVTVTDQQPVSNAAERRARSLLSRLGLPAPTRTVLLNPVRLSGRVVRLAAIDPLPRWTGRSVGACRPRACPAVLVGGTVGQRTLRAPGVRIVVSGAGRLRSAAPLGFAPTPHCHPLLVSGDVNGLAGLPALSSLYRARSWVSEALLAGLHSWQLADLERRLTRAQSDLPAGGGLSLSAPTDALAQSRDRAAAAPRRLLPAGGGALAVLAMFVILAAYGLRRDQQAERGRLRAAGARAGALVVFALTEAGWLAAVAVLAGAAVGLALTVGSADNRTLAILAAPLACLAAAGLVYRAAGALLRGGERLARRGPLPLRLALVDLARSPVAPALAVAFVAVSTARAPDGADPRRPRRPGRRFAGVSPGGWVRLGDERLRGAGIGDHLQAQPTGDGLLLTPTGAQAARPVPVPETIPARGTFCAAKLDVRSVRRVLGGRAVLDELTVFFIRGRMTVVVVGRSGAGKTTLLELLAGLAHPDAGEVLLDERALGSGGERLAAVRRAWIGYLPQEPVPVGFLSATENVALALHARGCARIAATRDARAALTAVGLAERCDQRVERLSAGEAQRVALARALASSRGLLIVDEPTSRLDEETAAAVADLLVAAAQDGGHTVICATHDPQVIDRAHAVVTLVP